MDRGRRRFRSGRLGGIRGAGRRYSRRRQTGDSAAIIGDFSLACAIARDCSFARRASCALKWRTHPDALDPPPLALHETDDGPARGVTVVRLPTLAVVVQAEHRTGGWRTLYDVGGGDVEGNSLEIPVGVLHHQRALFGNHGVEVRIDPAPGRSEEAARRRE